VSAFSQVSGHGFLAGYQAGYRQADVGPRFGRRWMELVDSRGGTHHGCFLPAEGASGKALALFSFPGLAACEQYRGLSGTDPGFTGADRIRDESSCVLRYERTLRHDIRSCRSVRACARARGI
jgi:NIPSNAP